MYCTLPIIVAARCTGSMAMVWPLVSWLGKPDKKIRAAAPITGNAVHCKVHQLVFLAIYLLIKILTVGSRECLSLPPLLDVWKVYIQFIDEKRILLLSTSRFQHGTRIIVGPSDPPCILQGFATGGLNIKKIFLKGLFIQAKNLEVLLI